MLAALAVFCLIYIITAFLLPADSPSSIASEEKTRQIEKLIDDVYLGKIDKQLLTDYMFLGLVSGLEDRYSTYYTAKEYDDITSKQSGYFEGVGVEITEDPETGKSIVNYLYEGAPADRAGMKEGDLLLSVNGTDVTAFTPTEVVELIRSDETGIINMTVLRGEEKLDFSMKPERILRDPVVSEMLEDNIGYIKISTFDNLTAEQFKTELDSLKEAGMKSLIIDLRGNLGGLVNSACDTMNEFLPEGLLVYTEDKNGERKEHYCDGKNELDIPMALLVDSLTASSAEIFAGAVKDYGVATLIGTQTFGKGIVQNTYELADDSAVRLTTAHYYTPEGHDIHGQGITPDIIVEDEEAQLQRAVELLSDQ